MIRASYAIIPIGYLGIPVGGFVWLANGYPVIGIPAMVIRAAAATLAITRLRKLGRLRVRN
jgi:hypothetical protein